MNRVISTVLIGALTFCVCAPMVSVALFRLNRAQIVERCCERRTADCAGTCYLNKNLRRDDDRQSQSSAKLTIPAFSIDGVVSAPVAAPCPSRVFPFLMISDRSMRDGYLQIAIPPPRFV